MIGAPRLRVGLRAMALEAGSGAGGPGAAGLNRADEQASGSRLGRGEPGADWSRFPPSRRGSENGGRWLWSCREPRGGRCRPASLPARCGKAARRASSRARLPAPPDFWGARRRGGCVCVGCGVCAEGPQVLRGVPAGAAWHPCPGFTRVGAVPDQVLG